MKNSAKVFTFVLPNGAAAANSVVFTKLKQMRLTARERGFFVAPIPKVFAVPDDPHREAFFIWRNAMNVRFSQIVAARKVAEANIQAEFYMLCRKHGVQVLLEVAHENCRFDAVVFVDDKAFLIVEVKNFSPRCSARGLKKTGRQWNKYSRYGLPIIEILNSRQIMPKFQEVLRLISSLEKI